MNSLCKAFILAIAGVALSGCQDRAAYEQYQARDAQYQARDAVTNIRTICLDGVQYYFLRQTYVNVGHGYMSVKFNRDGTVATCNDVESLQIN